MATPDEPLGTPESQEPATGITPGNEPEKTMEGEAQQPSTDIQEKPEAQTEQTIPLPPPPSPSSAPEGQASKALASRLFGFDVVLVVLVLAFAFMVAAFPISNSDILHHLAVGRLLSQGEYTFGTDPFTFTTEGTWVNQSWLYGWVLYLIHGDGDLKQTTGIVLVVLKGLLVVVLAVLMLRSSRRPGQAGGLTDSREGTANGYLNSPHSRWWIPAACTGLALLVMSPRFHLQPSLLSFLFVALTLYLLVQPSRSHSSGETGDAASPRTWWFLPLVFVLWVNLDSWFVLGPIMVALYLLGECLQTLVTKQVNQASSQGEQGEAQKETPVTGGRSTRALSRLGLILLISLAACFLNPHTWRAFQLPGYLGGFSTMEAFGEDMRYSFVIGMPFSQEYFLMARGLSIAGQSFFVLLLLGVLSFGLNYQTLIWWRALLWVSFAVLASFHTRAIPFFAIVAGPITALNFLDFAEEQFGKGIARGRQMQQWILLGRLLTIAACLALIVATIPGWLQSLPHASRRLGFGFRMDDSLIRAGKQINAWQQEGKIEPGTRWFNYTPQSGNYLAWYCPKQRYYYDHRLWLLGQAAQDAATVWSSLEEVDNQGSPPQASGSVPEYAPVLNDRDVGYVMVSTSNPWGIRSILAGMYLQQEEGMSLIYLQGGTTIFGWNRSSSKARPGTKESLPAASGERLAPPDFEQLAFGEQAVQAPAEGPDRPPRFREWYEDLWNEPQPETTETKTAEEHLIRAGVLEGPNFARKVRTALASFVCLGVGGPRTPGLPGLYSSLTPMKLCYRPPRIPRLLPPESVYLAVRAARQAVKNNPDDVGGYLVLARAYHALRQRTADGLQSAQLGLADSIRQAQVTGALKRVLAGNPTLVQRQTVHQMLAQIYYQQRYLDLTLEHSQKALECVAQMKPAAGISKEDREKALKAREEQLKEVERLVRNKKDEHKLETDGMFLLQKAQRAMSKKYLLPGVALDLLRNAKREELYHPQNKRYAPGAVQQLQLLLAMGELEPVREALTDSLAPALGQEFGGLPAYDCFHVILAAASGNYDKADAHLAKMEKAMARTPFTEVRLRQLLILGRQDRVPEGSRDSTLVPLLLGHHLLQYAPQAAGFPWQWQAMQWQLRVDLAQLQLGTHPRQLTAIYQRNPRLGGVLEARQWTRRYLEYQVTLGTLRAWLALEQGNTTRAREQLEKVVRISKVSGGGELRVGVYSATPLAFVCLRNLNMGKLADQK